MPIPVFILSMPRAGSTLLQRLLATHPQIATISESHLLLPFIYPLRQRGVYAEYDHKYTHLGFRNFIAGLDGGQAAYLDAVREFALGLYGQVAGPGARYFVDKAGALSLVVDELLKMFPDGKFVFLWRNPLAVVSSMMLSWRAGRWSVHEYEVYLFRGLPALADAYREGAAGAAAVRYEDLVVRPEATASRIFEYLDLSPTEADVTGFSDVRLTGGLGDLPGMQKYREISQEPLSKWKATLANPLRRSWCRRYLEFVGAERLATMGYDLAELQAELAGLPFSLRYLASDLFRRPYTALFKLLEGRILRDKLEDLRAGRRYFLHH